MILPNVPNAIFQLLPSWHKPSSESSRRVGPYSVLPVVMKYIGKSSRPSTVIPKKPSVHKNKNYINLTSVKTLILKIQFKHSTFPADCLQWINVSVANKFFFHNHLYRANYLSNYDDQITWKKYFYGQLIDRLLLISADSQYLIILEYLILWQNFKFYLTNVEETVCTCTTGRSSHQASGRFFLI